MKKSRQNYGFSLTEVTIVIIVISVIAALALPRYTSTIEKTRSAEGVSILEALRKAQWVFFYENNQTFAANLADLDTEITGSDNFGAIAPTVSVNAATLATVVRDGNLYTLSIADDGDITCSGAAGNLCSEMGF